MSISFSLFVLFSFVSSSNICWMRWFFLILNTKYQIPMPHQTRRIKRDDFEGKVCLYFVCQQKCIWDNWHTIVWCPVQWHQCFLWVLETGCLFYLGDYLNTLSNDLINNPCKKNQEPNDKWISFNYFNYPTDVLSFFCIVISCALVVWMFCHLLGIEYSTNLYVIQHTYKSFQNPF